MSKCWIFKETGMSYKLVLVSTDNLVQDILRKVKKSSNFAQKE